MPSIRELGKVRATEAESGESSVQLPETLFFHPLAGHPWSIFSRMRSAFPIASLMALSIA